MLVVGGEIIEPAAIFDLITYFAQVNNSRLPIWYGKHNYANTTTILRNVDNVIAFSF